MTGEPRSIFVFGLDLGLRAALAVALEPSFAIEPATSAAALLGRLASASPVLAVICLASSPEVSGLVRALRARCPGCCVLLVGSGADSSAFNEAVDMRADMFCPGPPSLRGIVRCIGIRRLEPGDAPLRLRFSDPVSRALDFMSRHYREVLSIQAIAGAAGLSGSRLAHVFRADTGMTLKTYLARLRVHVAKVLLSESSEKLHAVAERVGFYDTSHLCRVFTEYVGRSPGAYRRASPA